MLHKIFSKLANEEKSATYEKKKTKTVLDGKNKNED